MGTDDMHEIGVSETKFKTIKPKILILRSKDRVRENCIEL